MPAKDYPPDEVGAWSEIKLEILEKYARAYTTILSRQREIRKVIYIDGFAGLGMHISRRSGDLIPGSPARAAAIDPPFTELHFVDIHGDKAEALRARFSGDPRVTIHSANANAVLPQEVFPMVRYEDYHRALCVLDPYGLDLDWRVIETAGKARSIEIFVNFPLMDMNRNVLWEDPTRVDAADADRMSCFWGDNSWREAAYRDDEDLFGRRAEKRPVRALGEAFRERLRSVAGFRFVPEPLLLRNRRNAPLYYLFFASFSFTGGKIVREIFRRYAAPES